MKIKLLKLLNFLGSCSRLCFRGFGLAVVAALCLTASVSAQKRMTQRCQGSATSAKVEISKQGDITIAKCSGRTLTIDGQSVAVGTLRYVFKFRQSSTNPPVVFTTLYNNTGETITWTYNGVGDYTATVANPIFTPGKTKIVVTSFVQGFYAPGFCYASSFTTNSFKVYCRAIDGVTATDIGYIPTREPFIDIEVYP